MNFESLFFSYKSTYYKFPQPLKTFLGTLYGNVPLSVRFGTHYDIHKKILLDFENASEQYKLDYMYNKTLETLIFAEENIKFYKTLFNEYDISSKSFKSLDDIKLFPSLTKNDIKKNIEILYCDKMEKPVAYYSGGSTSAPTKYFLPDSSRAKEKAYNNYIFSKVGYKYRDKAIMIKGRDISNLEKNIFWEYEPVDNFFVLSNAYINSDKFPMMYQKVLEFNPIFFVGYPSAILSFIKEAKLHNFKKLDIEGVILTSETIYPNELKIIMDYFGADVLTHYGHTERNSIGYRINMENYHFINSYGLTRIANNEIITTTFDNFVMPFINYKTGDLATGNISYYKDSDIATEAEHIEGRTQDFLVTKDNRLISITTMCSGQDSMKETINAIQYIQSKSGEVTVLIEGNTVNVNTLKAGMRKIVHDGIDFNIKIVDNIEKSSRGKRVICKQSLDIEKMREII